MSHEIGPRSGYTAQYTDNDGDRLEVDTRESDCVEFYARCTFSGDIVSVYLDREDIQVIHTQLGEWLALNK